MPDANDKKLFAIGPAARQAGVSRQTVQYYLMIGLMDPTQTTPTGRRLFDDEAVKKIRMIKKLNQSGYPLRAIRDLFFQPSKPEKTQNHD
ncbi:MAG TPA: MerR family transcriptional regulator [Anaerohalosphaeraceae bacterium]|jgi:MerR family mercuric resistance operon transcriptional regulator|nr:MerR family transcriptional regulator [Anaerohalosphaeraceae bacterium]